jgi:hypothetical protein
MQTLIPAEAATYVARQSTLDILAACRTARARYYDTTLTVGDPHGAAHSALAVAAYEQELAQRGITVIASGPDLNPDPALDPRPEDIHPEDVDEPGGTR